MLGKIVAGGFAGVLVCLVSAANAQVTATALDCAPATGSDFPAGRRIVCADIAALDQMLVYNRFGSFNPFGMVFALTRDLMPVGSGGAAPDAAECDSQDGTASGDVTKLAAGEVRLRDCKRPRPLVLRANAGDILKVRVRNLLRDLQPGFSETFCRQKDEAKNSQRQEIREHVSEGTNSEVDHGEALCQIGSLGKVAEGLLAGEPELDWPRTRGLSFAIEGLVTVAGTNADAAKADAERDLRVCRGLASIEPGEAVDCVYEVDREGTYFLASNAAPAGGEGDGGSIVHGLFGAVVVEQRHTRWYRSQVSRAAFDGAWPTKANSVRHARGGQIDYEATGSSGIPLLNLARPTDGTEQADFDKARAVEIVHSDINAIIFRPAGAYRPPSGNLAGPPIHSAVLSSASKAACEAGQAPAASDEFCEVSFREFSVFFHDELKTFYTRNFQELGQFGQLAGIRDAFGINYGASGMGSILLANRKNIGPSAGCAECLYEEFFLTSWANGDPALLEQFSDDPSNVHHSYLNDPISFRNLHAGPKETHVFHLHAHQWFAGNDPNRGSYLDSQTIAPRQGFTYDIYHGGLRSYAPGQEPNGKGWFETLGSGNRNRTIGDSIFHCHLYPHFAQGMWALWRVHDVIEDGTRKLADGQAGPGLSVAEVETSQAVMRRPGSVHPLTGQFIHQSGKSTDRVGTPIPAIVPLPNSPLPLLPTYAKVDIELSMAGAVAAPATTQGTAEPTVAAMPGYPFTLAGRPGHRPPQAPMDIARELVGGEDSNKDDVTAEYLDAGLPRHVVKDAAEREFGVALPSISEFDPTPEQLPDAGTPAGRTRERIWSQIVAKMLALGDMTAHLKKATLELLPYDGTPLERAAMGFHFDGNAWGTTTALTLKKADGTDLVVGSGTPQAQPGLYSTLVSPLPGGSGGTAQPFFAVNGAPPKPGAPFADPCGAPGTGGAFSISDKTVTLGGKTVVVRVNDDETIAGAAKDSDPLPGTKWIAARPGDIANWAVRLRAGEKLPLLSVDGGKTVLPIAAQRLVSLVDPFLKPPPVAYTAPFFPDPGLIGFRRYEVSAVQLDLVTNRAGWHDPQARIAVLSSDADRFKDGNTQGFPAAPISPLVSAREEPFFFRALSGECVEFRHTNELPKELDLDDFQVKTPTDTIGQHIHLVKFDVTSSDGSGNGFNYEDGTFAPDEVATRLCAAEKAGATLVPDRLPGALELKAPTGFCRDPITVADTWWRQHRLGDEDAKRPIIGSPDRFQTTVQRWFADPILAADSSDGTGGLADRTMRTVFSHDHFGPSSIQQHGYYTALVIEPQGALWTNPGGVAAIDANDPEKVGGLSAPLTLSSGRAIDVGTRKAIVGADDRLIHSDFREFALTIADFALLYDPRDRESRADATPDPNGFPDDFSGKGMAMLYCELNFRSDPNLLKEICGSAMKFDSTWFADEDVPPAWHAHGRRQDAHSSNFLTDDEFLKGTRDKLKAHLLQWRLAAATGATPANWETVGGPAFARPVAPPKRPESISVDHHDPYLVNYRGEPIPLRVGTKEEGGTASADCQLRPMLQPWRIPMKARIGGPPLDGGAEDLGTFAECSIDWQRTDPQGDMANVFSSKLHFDPATPILETYSGERNVIRLIQGAQEVQHTFNIEGALWHRNIDQRFPAGSRLLDSVWRGDWKGGGPFEAPTLHQACMEFGKAREGRPREYAQWASNGWQSFDNSTEKNFWKAYTELQGECDNLEGFVTAQEVGISEHFEFGGAARSGLNLARRFQRPFSLSPSSSSPALSDNIDALVPVQDYLFHFGSQDALWNGAWGLLRIFSDDGVVDTTDEHDGVHPPLVGTVGIKSLLAPLTTIADVLDKDPESNTLYGKYAKSVECPSDADHVHALVIARNRGPRPNSASLFDPDPLHLTLVDPEDVFLGGRQGLADEFAKSGHAPEIELDQAKVDGLPVPSSPLRLTVKAGDCIHVAVVNAMTAHRTFQATQAGFGPRADLPDALGDALMPPIVPLNVDPAWGDKDILLCKAGDALCRNRPLAWEASLTAGEIAAHKRLLSPSASFALRIPLPSLTPNDQLALPIGVGSKPALGPRRDDVSGRITVSIEYITVFAGRAALPELTDRKLNLLAAREGLIISDHSLDTASESGPTVTRSIAGKMLTLSEIPRKGAPRSPTALASAADRFQSTAEAELRAAVEAKCKLVDPIDSDQIAPCVPYAFGAIPIASLADVIGHAPHGLIGAIVVEPNSWIPQAGVEEIIPTGTDDVSATTSASPSTGKTLIAVPLGDKVASNGLLFTASEPCVPMLEGAWCPQPPHKIREHVVFYRDGMNLWDRDSKDRWVAKSGGPLAYKGVDLGGVAGVPLTDNGDSGGVAGRGGPVADCHICDESYDSGEKGVGYTSAPFNVRLRAEGFEMNGALESHYDLNAFLFPDKFFLVKKTNEEPASDVEEGIFDVAGKTSAAMPILRAEAGEEVVIRVLHPSGRARQRAFVTTALDYDDIFPGFGFPHAALVGPGKGVTASIARSIRTGCYLWQDGPTPLRAGGTWGLLDVVERGQINTEATSCARAPAQ